MKNIDITWKIGGEAGFGIMVTGASFAKICSRLNLNVITNTEYPSLIRGGHNNYTVRASNKKIYALKNSVDLLIALNKNTIDLHKTELVSGGILIYDPKDYQPQEGDFTPDIRLLPIPLYDLAKQNQGDVLMRNTVALGASLAIFHLDFSVLETIIRDEFQRKGEEIVRTNILTAKAGFDFVCKIFEQNSEEILKEQVKSKMVCTGNEAIAIGALSADVKFFCAYPMTPINGLITYFSNHEQKYQYIYKQPEDEIAAINMSIGASYTGVRAMTATSGGGFALMNEALSMAGITETPLVIILGQRPGPASGLPTWTSQGDLNFAINSGHGEFLKFVFTPGDTEEAFWLTKLAFNLADKYQTPVILLTDKYLNESVFSLDLENLKNTKILPADIVNYANTIDRGEINQKPQTTYLRYQDTKSGISARIFPGSEMYFTVNSYEHEESGLSTENAAKIKKMVDKRIRKAKTAQLEAFGPILYGNNSADLTLVGWGTTKMAVLEAINILTEQKAKFNMNYLHFPCVEPFPVQNALKLLSSANKVVDVEGNSQAQLSDLIRKKTGFTVHDKILKYDGRQFYPEEIISAVKVILKEK